MSPPIPSRVVGLVAENSPAYVERGLELLAAGTVWVSLRGADDQARISAAKVTEVETPSAGSGWISPRHEPRSDEQLALISFTSGTEGQPKGVLLSHRALGDVVQRLIDVMGLDGSIREYLGVPVYHSFGFGRCRAVGAVGGQVYLPPDGFNPMEIAAMLKAGEINAVSAVPSLWRSVLEAESELLGAGERLKWIEIGSQYMSADEKRALRRIFPNARIVQHYGLTEASRSTFLRIDGAADDLLESVGRATGNVEIQLAADGRVQIRGPHLASGLIVDGKFEAPAGDGGWYPTSDRGELRGDHLHFLGRLDDVINCGGIKLSPDPLEAAIRERTGVSGGFAVCRVPDRLRGDGILLVWTPAVADQAERLGQALLEETALQGIQARGAIRGTLVQELPLTASGKVRRRDLSEAHAEAPLLEQRAARTTESASGDGAPLTDRERELVAIWQQALGVTDLRIDESFYDLGGDSVTALSVVVRMSRAGLDVATCRRIFQGATIRELARAELRTETSEKEAAPADRAVNADYVNTLMVNALRGLLVAAVIVGHWSEGALERLGLMSIAPALAPFFSFGTPGFAIVFGLGFGYLFVDRLTTNAARVWQAVRLGTIIVTCGILVLAAVQMLVTEEPLEYASIFEFFYSPLTFYALALPTMPLWGRLLLRFPHGRQVLGAGVLALACYGISQVFDLFLGDLKPDGFLRLARLMLVAKFNYFIMMGGSLVGLAAGLHLRRTGQSERVSSQLGLAGLALLAASLVIALALGELGLLVTWPSPLKTWKWLTYAGAVLLILSALLTLRANYGVRGRSVRQVIELLASVGQLALPFYVFHEAVIPAKALLVRAGVGDAAAIVLVLAGFFGVSVLMVRRVKNVFHSA